MTSVNRLSGQRIGQDEVMNKEDIAELLMASAGFLLITLAGTGTLGLSVLAWVGVLLIQGALFWHWHRTRKKARKEGKEIFS